MDGQIFLPIFVFLSKVIAVGGTAAAIGYGAFIFFGKKWLETKFSERLEAYKHEQSKELEQVKYKINSQFNRITKIHEKEIEVLPQAWSKLHNALMKASYFTSPMREYTNPDLLTADQLESFLASSSLSDWEKSELKISSGKFQYYKQRMFLHELIAARTAYRDFRNYILENSIFLSQDLKVKFLAIDDAIWSALIDKEVGHDVEDWEMQRKSFSQIKETIEPIKLEIEALVQKRLQLDHAF